MSFSQPHQATIGRSPQAAADERRLLRLLARLLAGSGERRVRLRTLALIRWIAIIGQAFTIALVHFSLEFRLPLWPLLGAVGLSALINLILSAGFTATTRLTERSAGVLLGYDILQLAFLLGLTGGLQNPFSILLIVPVTLSATTLSLRTTVVLCTFVIVAATVLGLFPTDLPWYQGSFYLPPLYLGGVWLALVLGTMLVAGYAWRIADEAQAAVGRTRGDPDGARARAAALGARRPRRGRRARARQPARDDRGDRARARQQRAAAEPARRGHRRAGRREPALPRDPAHAQPAARERGARARSPGCRSRPCSRRWPTAAGGGPASRSTSCASSWRQGRPSRSSCRRRSCATRSST